MDEPIKEISCETLLQYLSDYIDDELDEGLTAAARHHLATCHNCKVVLNTTRRTIELVGDKERRSIPAGRREALFDRLAAAFQSRPEAD